ncbi:MAG: hypothetical protein RMJ14_00185 [Nitrososphaerota archaeon]|nr:hypothetical protein [Aigarchaeota archaeon]MDW8076051.1 hypothetical protein [Nitrososphaerota archaeon]
MNVLGKCCGNCNYWLPLDVLPALGECRNVESTKFGKVAFQDSIPCKDFEERCVVETDFYWCKDCRTTFYREDLKLHEGHKVFIETSTLPIEDIVEYTFAGD